MMPRKPASPDAGDIVQDALDSGRIGDGRARLAAWEASQPVNVDTLSKLRYYWPLLGEHQKAIEAAKAMLALRPAGAWERIADHLRLGELSLAIGALDDAWNALTIVLHWPELPDWYSAGLARSTAELAFDISAAAEQPLAERAFEAAMRLLDAGCSTSLCLLEKARDCSKRLKRGKLFKRFEGLAAAEQQRIQRQIEGT